MRRTTITVLAVLAVLLPTVALAAPPSGHGPPVAQAATSGHAYVPQAAGLGTVSPEDAERAGRVRSALAAQTHAPFGAPSLDNFGTTTYLHFGSPSAGQAVIEGWIRQAYSDLGLPLSNQGQCRGIRLLNVRRLAIRCILHTRGGTRDDDATSATVNSADVGNPLSLRVNSPSITANSGGDPAGPQFCESWTEVRYAIRWTDDTLSSGKTFSVPSDLWNDNCYFLEAP